MIVNMQHIHTLTCVYPTKNGNISQPDKNFASHKSSEDVKAVI